MFLLKLIDDFLNGITMYRVVLYVLIVLLVVAIVFTLFGILPFNIFSLIFTAVLLILVCWITNKGLAKVFQAPANLESFFITALILALVITPVRALSDLPFLFLAAVSAMASKYFLAINRKHIFNPAAFAIVVTPIFLQSKVSWWVDNTWMMPFVVIGGLLIVRKIRKSPMVIVLLLIAFLSQNNLLSLLFFAFVMLTEPQTTPPAKFWQIIYGSLVGLLASFLSPETSLILANTFSYLVSPKGKLLLVFQKKIKLAPDIYELIFNLEKRFSFLPGQYLEWTLPHPNPDSRGFRRYFTIASSPTEKELKIGVRFSPQGSSFKKALLVLKPGDKVMVGNLTGDFTLPKDPNTKLCFLAGGIGVTPYRSMIKYLLDTNQKRDIVLIYSARSAKDFVYRDIFNKAKKMGIRTILKVGQIDTAMIQETPDFKGRIFYISGPHSMVDAFGETLQQLGIPKQQIKVDFFPGYA